jgi:hypothetical protein
MTLGWITISMGKITFRPRHAVGNADAGGIVALAAGGLVGEACFENRLVFRRQRRLLAAPDRLGDVPLVDDGNGSVHPRLLPLAGEIRVFRFIECLRRSIRRHERRCECESTQPIPSEQGVSLLIVLMMTIFVAWGQGASNSSRFQSPRGTGGHMPVIANAQMNWHRLEDSNPRRTGLEPVTLTTERSRYGTDCWN